MREFWAVCCLYRTPVSFCSSPDFDRIPSKTIKIATIETIYFLNNIEIIKKSSLIGKEILSFYDGNTIEWKTDPLINTNNEIKKKSKEKHSIDKWDGEDMAYISRDDVFPSRKFKSSVSFANFLEKNYFSFFKFKSIFFREFFILSSELKIEFFNFFEDFLYC